MKPAQDITISTIVGGAVDEGELRSLRDWLSRERPGLVQVIGNSAPHVPGTLGALSDALQIALGAGGAVTVLAGSVGTWISTRRQSVTLVLTRPDGKQIEIDAQVKKPDVVIARFLAIAVSDGASSIDD